MPNLVPSPGGRAGTDTNTNIDTAAVPANGSGQPAGVLGGQLRGKLWGKWPGPVLVPVLRPSAPVMWRMGHCPQHPLFLYHHANIRRTA